MLETILYVVLFCLSCLLIWRFYNNCTSPLAAIPSPPGYPIVGHFPVILKTETLDLFRQWIPKYSKNGLLRYAPFFSPERVLVSNLEYLKRLLITEAHKVVRPRFIRETLPFGDGIFGSSGQHHAWQRKLLHPTFSSVSVGRFDGLFEKHALELVKHWKQKIDNSEEQRTKLNIEDDIGSLMLNIIGDAAFGYEFDNFHKKDLPVIRAFRKLLLNSFNPWQILKARYLKFLGSYVKYFGSNDFQSSLKIVHDTINEVIAAKRAKLADQSIKDTIDSKKMDLLELMMGLQDEDSGKKMSKDLLGQNVLTFMLAGFETTSTCLTWTLYLLARHPEIQERARKEVVKATLKDTRITRENIDKMPFITCILKESLRMYPPIPFLGREVVSPICLGEVKLPTGSHPIAPFIYIHRNKDLWASPDDFLPERFLQQDVDELSSDRGFHYMPFSHGPRSCIGSKFAMLEMRIILAVLLKAFRFSITADHPEVKMKTVLSLKPTPPPLLLVELIQ